MKHPFFGLQAGLQRVNSRKWITARTAVRGLCKMETFALRTLSLYLYLSLNLSPELSGLSRRELERSEHLQARKMLWGCARGRTWRISNKQRLVPRDFVYHCFSRHCARPRTVYSPACRRSFQTQTGWNTPPQHPPRNRRCRATRAMQSTTCPATLSSEINLPPSAHEERDVKRV